MQEKRTKQQKACPLRLEAQCQRYSYLHDSTPSKNQEIRKAHRGCLLFISTLSKTALPLDKACLFVCYEAGWLFLS